MPKRIQRKRTRGWRMPPNTFYVGNGTIWWNQYDNSPEGLKKYEDLIRYMITEYGGIKLDIESLRGKDLACWCALTDSCHGDVLLKIANVMAYKEV